MTCSIEPLLARCKVRYTSDMTKNSPQYTPGVCNINHDEIVQRRKAGQLGLGLGLLILATVLSFELAWWWSVVAWPMLFVAAIGYLQAKNKFCVGYAAAGLQNATDGQAKASEVVDAQAKKLDKARAKSMNLQAAGMATVATALFAGLTYLLV